MEYTYILPNEEDLRDAIRAKLDRFPSDINDMAESLLSVSSLELQELDTCSDKDRLIHDIAIVLRTPLSVFKDYSWEIDDVEKAISNTANDILPRNCGFRVKYTDTNPSVGTDMSDARTLISKSLEILKYNTLGEDLIEKGKRMANAYIIIYCLENLLREFMDRMFTKFYGTDYESQNVFPSKTRNKACDRKRNESLNKWLPIRGDKMLYYLDFSELADVITLETNWNNIFKKCFPNQFWITNKIDELYQIRNRIAHNSYLDDKTFKTLELYYEQFVDQLGKNEGKA